MEDTKKTAFPKKLTDFQDEMIAAQAKIIATLEDSMSLLRENVELKEKVFRLEMQVEDAIQVPPIHNGIIKIMEESRK